MSRRVSLRIHYDQRSGLVALLALALLAAAMLAHPAWGQREAAASSLRAPLAASTSMRRYYLTKSNYDGTDADDACANGYHMASLWEILDPSNLKYNTTLGFMRNDSGQGPPTVLWGWVRTGYSKSGSTTAGQGNCTAWTSISGEGTYAQLPNNWIGVEDIHVWDVGATLCSSTVRVWCMEDHIIYLPLILRNHGA